MVKYEPLHIGNKIAAVPLIQGGMGVGISLGGLAGAVAKEGGVGIISSAQIGFKNPLFDKNVLQANLEGMEQEYNKARAIAPEGVIGFNIMVALQHYDDYVKKAVELGADIIISGAGLPIELPQYAKESDTCLAPIVSTEKSARVLLKMWDRKHKRMPDLLVIEGPLAGGHLGFHREQLDQFAGDAYEAEIRKIMDIVREYGIKYNKEIPVVLAGGIDDHEKVAHAMSLGVQGVQVATRFVTTVECDADERYKQSYIQAKQEDIIIVKSPVGMPGRAIRNTFMKKVEEEGRIPVKTCHQCLVKCDRAAIPYCITDAMINAALGNLDKALLFCGANAYKAERIETVKEVMDSLMKDGSAC
ncbi:MAG: nitronate monooxygenase family protein [Lachnospiraceae bacterium]|nr:nitronate monooxygenase family protein [Lachnospiraceae bacterium]